MGVQIQNLPNRLRLLLELTGHSMRDTGTTAATTHCRRSLNSGNKTKVREMSGCLPKILAILSTHALIGD